MQNKQQDCIKVRPECNKSGYFLHPKFKKNLGGGTARSQTLSSVGRGTTPVCKSWICQCQLLWPYVSFQVKKVHLKHKIGQVFIYNTITLKSARNLLGLDLTTLGTFQHLFKLTAGWKWRLSDCLFNYPLQDPCKFNWIKHSLELALFVKEHGYCLQLTFIIILMLIFM